MPSDRFHDTVMALSAVGAGANRSSASRPKPPTISEVQITVTARLPSTSNSTSVMKSYRKTPANTEGIKAMAMLMAKWRDCGSVGRVTSTFQSRVK